MGSCRRELLDHVIVLNESHLRRLVRDYLKYYHDDRIHDALQKETPTLRLVERRPSGTGKVMGAPRVGGLHHRLSLANRRLKCRLVQASAPLPCPSREVQIQKRQGIKI